jgi:hypothetical protein
VASFAEAARALGDQYLQDVLALRAGERWDARLLQLIEAADVFQLFWSSNSMRSQHCQDEWEHALALGRPLFIRPVYWEEPLPQDPGQELPPAALRELHFVKVPVAAQYVPSGVVSYPPPPPGLAYGRPPSARFSRRPRALLVFSAVVALVLLIAVILAVVRR